MEGNLLDDAKVKKTLKSLNDSLDRLLDYDYPADAQGQRDHNVKMILEALVRVTDKSLNITAELTGEYSDFFERLENTVLTHPEDETRLDFYKHLNKVIKKDSREQIADHLSAFALHVIEKAAEVETISENRLEALDLFTRGSAAQPERFAAFIEKNWPKDALNLLLEEKRDAFYLLYVRMIGEILYESENNPKSENSPEWHNNILKDLFYISGPINKESPVSLMNSVKQSIFNVWKERIAQNKNIKDIDPYITALEEIIDHPEMAHDIRINAANDLQKSPLHHPGLEERVIGCFEDQISKSEGLRHKFITTLRGRVIDENAFITKIKECLDDINQARMKRVTNSLTHALADLEDLEP